MSDEITRVLDSYIQQEKRLLNQLSQIQGQRYDIGTEIGKEVVSLGAREILGRTGGKIVRRLMIQGEKVRARELEAAVDAQHRGNVLHIRGFLRTVSEFRKKLEEPNSDRLISRLERAQDGVRVATRIRATMRLLSSLKSKRLVFNKDIPIIEKKGAVLSPGSPFSGMLELRKILSSTTEYVKICDQWVDIPTLEILLSVPEAIPIKLLTGEAGKSRRFLRACSDFQVERPGFEVRIGEGLHDRFILTKKQGWLVGSSIKDFGKKFSAVIPLLESEKQDTEKIFDDLWKKSPATATPLRE